MICKLCDHEIKNYNAALHHLVLDEKHDVDICQECVDKLINWQGSIIARLFPTKMLKKRFEKK
jgi:hypothetical protein